MQRTAPITQPRPLESMVFPDAKTLVAFVRHAERSGRGDLVERVAAGGLAVYPDGAIGFMVRSAA